RSGEQHPASHPHIALGLRDDRNGSRGRGDGSGISRQVRTRRRYRAADTPNPNAPSEPIEFISDGEPLFECPLCHHRQGRKVSEIVSLALTEATKRKPPIPPGVH